MSYIDLNPNNIKSKPQRDFVIWLDLILGDLCGLSERQREIIIMYFVLNKTYEEIGNEQDLTKERVRQILNKGIEKINKSIPIVENHKKLIHSLQQENYKLSGDLKEIVNTIRRAKNISRELRKVMAIAGGSFTTKKVIKLRLDALNLSVRTMNILKAFEINSVQDLLNYGRINLIRIPRLGRQAMTELDEELRRLGLSIH